MNATFWRYTTRRKLILLFCILVLILVVFEIKKSSLLYGTNKNKKPRQMSYFETAEESHVEVYNGFLTEEAEKCETIQIAVVCAGYKASREVVTLIKSVLFHRHLPIHMHFIVDAPAKKILGTLFRTWDVSDFTVSFYLADKLEPKVSWIPNLHYSGVYGLMKLLLLDVLPVEIDKVIILDIDLIFLEDIGKLWDQFSQFVDNQVIGLVENQSDWYLGKVTKHPWPALGRGFNTGLMLLHCEKLRQIKWNEIWESITKKELLTFSATALADQDIINAVIKEHQDTVFILPCFWNVQLSMNTNSESCYGKDISSIKVLHWNSPFKNELQNIHASLFQNMFYSYAVYDGALLRNPVGKCTEVEESREEISKDFCQEMLHKSVQLRRTHLYYLPFDYISSDHTDVTLTLHLSIDRIPMLDIICKHWEGPISVAVFLSDSDTIKLPKHIEISPTLSNRRNIGFHLVFQNFDDTSYPINLLRNIAWQQAVTEFVFLCDVDFLPSDNLYEHLKNAVLPLYPNSSKFAFIIPAFESLWHKFDFPPSKSELIDQWDRGVITPFRSYMWKVGHAATNYTKWRTSNEIYSVNRTKDFEPYVVLPKHLCPAYDKRFFGFGWNKVSHIMELDALGFKFLVLPYGFVIHLPHMASLDVVKYRSSTEYKNCIDNLKVEFIQDLVVKYGVSADFFY
uniref:LARGE xylosyl- and glucuronyltransferase 1-like n=1 Tax=Styela clava TaxID=7725 RepID=UPI0019396906|nr:LARGE xylosyl- and glucuronyltransferase 1-like [Styela clava]